MYCDTVLFFEHDGFGDHERHSGAYTCKVSYVDYVLFPSSPIADSVTNVPRRREQPPIGEFVWRKGEVLPHLTVNVNEVATLRQYTARCSPLVFHDITEDLKQNDLQYWASSVGIIEDRSWRGRLELKLGNKISISPHVVLSPIILCSTNVYSNNFEKLYCTLLSRVRNHAPQLKPPSLGSSSSSATVRRRLWRYLGVSWFMIHEA